MFGFGLISLLIVIRVKINSPIVLASEKFVFCADVLV